VELAGTVSQLLAWLGSNGAAVSTRLEPKRFKADGGERVGLIASADAAAGEAGGAFALALAAALWGTSVVSLTAPR
jgi:hypothetical protein